MREAFNASTIPSIEGLDAAQAERAFMAAGWSPLKNDSGKDPGHNSHVLFSPDGRQVARIATGNDPGFEAFADFCGGNSSPHLPAFEVNHKSDTGVQFVLTDGFARNGPPKEPDWADLRNRLSAMIAPPALPRPVLAPS